jgi:hypothetical protein
MGYRRRRPAVAEQTVKDKRSVIHQPFLPHRASYYELLETQGTHP